MPLQNLLVHTATIAKQTTHRDRFGQRASDSLDARDVPCRLSKASGSERVGAGASQEVTTTHVVYLASDVPVDESDSIVEVRDVNGAVLERDLGIVLVSPITAGDGQPSHTEVKCHLVRGQARG